MTHPRNPGSALDLSSFVAVNRPAAERRAASLVARAMTRPTASGGFAPKRAGRSRITLSKGWGWTRCRKPAQSVSIPRWSRPRSRRWRARAFPWAEIRYAVDQGAQEIDIVITRAHVLGGEWAALYDEVAAMRAACGAAHLKAILATGDLVSLRNVHAASMVAMQAGADFIKTSTGKEGVNATLPVGLTMCRAIRAYGAQTGHVVGFKPAGGMKTAKDALNWQILMAEELGRDWLRPDLFRLGASSMLADIERQLEHHITGRYAASHRHALA